VSRGTQAKKLRRKDKSLDKEELATALRKIARGRTQERRRRSFESDAEVDEDEDEEEDEEDEVEAEEEEEEEDDDDSFRPSNWRRCATFFTK
jgi:hypothetical protein